MSLPDKIVELRDATCADDEDALAIALPLLPAWPLVEVWDGARRVVRLTTSSPAGSEHYRISRSGAKPRRAAPRLLKLRCKPPASTVPAMAMVEVFGLARWDPQKGETVTLPRMATRRGAAMLCATIVGEGVEIDEAWLAPGELWTPPVFEP